MPLSHYPNAAQLAALRAETLARPCQNINGPMPPDEQDFLTEWLADETPGAHGSEAAIGIGWTEGPRGYPGALYMPEPDDSDLDQLDSYPVGAVVIAAATAGAWWSWLLRHHDDMTASYDGHPLGPLGRDGRVAYIGEKCLGCPRVYAARPLADR